MDLMLIANLLRRRPATRPSGSYAEDSYYLTHAPAPPMLLRLAPVAVIGAVLALVVDLWWH